MRLKLIGRLGSIALVALAGSYAAQTPGNAQAPAPAQHPVHAATPGEEREAAAWLAAHAHPFDPAALSEADLTPIVARLAGARIIGVGEATHGTHQDQAFKAELIKALVRAGMIDTLILECNRDAGAGFDRYVRTGEGDPAALIRSESFFRIWKGDEFAGLLLWLRAWNLQSEKPVGVIGIDDQDAGRDAAVALADLARREPALAAAIRADIGSLIPADGQRWPHFYRWLTAAPHADFRRAYAAVTRLRDYYDRPAKPAGADEAFAAAGYAARIAWQGFNQFELENESIDVDKLPIEYDMRRDRFMARNALDRLGPTRRAAVWAHDLHVLDFLPPTAVSAGYVTLGTEFKRQLGDAYRTVGFTWSRGAVLTTQRSGSSTEAMAAKPRDEPTSLHNDQPGELGHVFDAAAATSHAIAMWAPIREARGTPGLDGWRQSDYWRGHLGWRVDPATWQKPADRWGMPAGEGFDVLVWFARVSPQQRWPNVPIAD